MKKKFKSDDNLSVGELNNIRQNHIEKAFLAEVFDHIKFKKILISKVKPSGERMRAELVESLFGALYITCGYKYCQKFWAKILDSKEINQ